MDRARKEQPNKTREKNSEPVIRQSGEKQAKQQRKRLRDEKQYEGLIQDWGTNVQGSASVNTLLSSAIKEGRNDIF